jgi:hypothetical protein
MGAEKRWLRICGGEQENRSPKLGQFYLGFVLQSTRLDTNLSHPIYKNINRAIIYAPGSSHAYIQQIIKISQHMPRIKAYKLINEYLYYNWIKNQLKECGSVKWIHEELGATGTSTGRQTPRSRRSRWRNPPRCRALSSSRRYPK